MLRRIALLSLLFLGSVPAALLYQLRLTGVVSSGFAATQAINGAIISESLDGSRVEITIEIDFDNRPPGVLVPLGGGATELRHNSTDLSPEWIRNVTFTFLDFPTFTPPHLPISNVFEVRRNPAPPGATEVAPSTLLQDLAAANFGPGIESTRVGKSLTDNWELPGSGTASNQAFAGLVMAGIPAVFDANSVRVFGPTALSGVNLLFNSLQSFNTGNPNVGAFGLLFNRQVNGTVRIDSVEGVVVVPEPATRVIAAIGLLLATACHRATR